MDFTKVKAAAINIDVNEDMLTNELMSIPEHKWSSNTDQYSDSRWKTVFLTKNNKQEFNDFKTAKTIKHSEWFWDNDLDIPYIKSLVKSLPLTHIGMIRAFVLEGPLVMHTDCDHTTTEDASYRFGLTIASRLEEPMLLGKDSIQEKNLIFDDSVPHGFPSATGKQISIRVFGDFDYNQFNITKIYER